MASKQKTVGGEDVLLVVPHVKYKKIGGSLYVMTTRVAWMNQLTEEFKIVAPYAEIKQQRLSPDDKEKVQLQIKTFGSESYTFHYTNPKGRQQQFKDRNAVKDLLAKMLPKFHEKTTSELDQKVFLLKKNPTLYTMYEELVVGGIMSVDEFWSMRGVEDHLKKQEQEVGVPSHLLNDVKPASINSTEGYRYNLSRETITSIFRTYPSVKKKHLELVPKEMDEATFWSLFFQSHYFHRDRITIDKNDPFADCAKQDEEQMRDEVQQNRFNPFLNIENLLDNDVGEGYGCDSGTSCILNLGSSTGISKSGNKVHQQLIRRYNHLSIMVTKTQENAAGNSCRNAPSADVRIEKGKIINEKIHMDDLEEEVATPVIQLHLENKSHYFQGPVNLSSEASSSNPSNKSTIIVPYDESIRLCEKLRLETAQYHQPNLRKVISPDSALLCLTELSGLGTASSSASSLSTSTYAKAAISVEVERSLLQLYTVLSELLRHFWACFPVNTPQLLKKLATDTATADLGAEEFKALLNINNLLELIRNGNMSRAFYMATDEILPDANGRLLEVLKERNEFFESPLDTCAKFNRLEILKEIIERGVDVNDCVKNGYTAMHHAACWGRHECLKKIYFAGGNIQSRTKRGERPIEICRRYKQKECMHFLKWAEASDNIKIAVHNMRETAADIEKVQGRFTKEDKKQIEAICQEKMDWLALNHETTISQLIGKKSDLDDELLIYWQKLNDETV